MDDYRTNFIMKNNLFTLSLLLILLISCKNANFKQRDKELPEIQLLIENNKLDLSNRGLNQMPDLSQTEISELNLFNNNIKKFKVELLPKSLKYLNISNNKIQDSLNLKNLKLDKLNASNNKICDYYSHFVIRNLNISNNKLKSIKIYMPIYTLEQHAADTLDISNNFSLSNHLGINIASYNVIHRANITNNNRLYGVLDAEIFD